MKATIRSAIVCFITLSAALRADVGVFNGTGQNLRQVTTEDVRLDSIDVTITPGRGPFMYDGTVQGMDQAEYKCRFVLQNLTDKSCSIQVGFPIDSPFADEGEQNSEQCVLYLNFIARAQNETYHVLLGSQAPAKPAMLFTWTMNFQAHESKTLMVQYRIPMSMTFATTSKRGWFPKPPSTSDPLLEKLDWGLFEFAGYTTETGSSWAGNVKNATFTIINEPFERYLNQRPVFDCHPPEKPDDDKGDALMKTFASCHEWWYRDIKPTGWRPVKDGVQWTYKDFKPKEPISIGYYLTVFPRRPEDVGPWIDQLLRVLPDLHSKPERLATIRQVLLATYGQKSTDPALTKFLEDQIWYHPVKDFSLSKLTIEQQAVLTELDRRLDLIRKEARR